MNGRPSHQSSAAERLMRVAHDVLTAACTAAGDYVHRGRVDAHDITELPALNLRRSTGLNEAIGTGAERGTLEFEIDCLVSGDGWETAADALHAEAHAALYGDPRLGGMGLRCIRTEMRAQAADEIRGTLIATYQIQSMHRVHDITASL